MEIKERLSISIPKRVNRRLNDLAEDKGVSKNTLITSAIEDYLSQLNHTDTATDYLNGRLNQVTISQMNILTALTDIKRQLTDIEENLEDNNNGY